MLKSCFLAAGIFACVLGVEMLVIDSAVVMPVDGRGVPQHVTAPDWAPWTLLSVGAVTVLHFCNMHARASASGHPKMPGAGHW